jgi:hypothetical protein
MLGQHGDVSGARAQGRQGDDLEAEAVEQVRAELARRGHARQILIGGGHDAHIDTQRADEPMRVTSPYSTARSRRS